MLIYTHYVEGIETLLREALLKAGLRAGLFTGNTDVETRLNTFEVGGDDFLTKPIVAQELLDLQRLDFEHTEELLR